MACLELRLEWRFFVILIEQRRFLVDFFILFAQFLPGFREVLLYLRGLMLQILHVALKVLEPLSVVSNNERTCETKQPSAKQVNDQESL